MPFGLGLTSELKLHNVSKTTTNEKLQLKKSIFSVKVKLFVDPN